MNLQEKDILFSPIRKGRKKIADKSSWKREREKAQRHEAKGPPVIPSCVHRNSKQGYKCELSVQDFSKFHRHFYSTSNKITQDTCLLKYCVAQSPKKSAKKKTLTINYYLPKYESLPNNNRRVTLKKVCREAITTVLGISKDRINRICKQHHSTQLMPTERRGGDKRSKKYESRTESVKSYIKELKSLESHYVRGRSSVQYLSSSLSIKKLHENYIKNHDVPVKYEFFRRIFNKFFNLSFKSPATDACSKCIELKEVIKRESNQKMKTLLMTQQRIHKLKSKWFYRSLGCENDNEITFSFDCQKNLILPKVPDQSAYFSRQLYVYNLTICQGTSHAQQTEANTYIYTWMETEAAKGSNQIASAVYNRLMNTHFEPSISHIRLYCDGCGGQNKNSIVLSMLANWLQMKSPSNVEQITVIFPVVGHSFLPPDRIFGNIERKIKEQGVIVKPEEYFDIFSKFGTVLRLGIDFNFYDWKSSIQNAVKPPGSWHFKFNESKNFFILKNKINNRITVKGEPNYVAEIINYGNICKKGKSFRDIKPSMMGIGENLVNAAKLQDVKNLLNKHFGEEWPTCNNLSYYKFVLDQTVNVESENGNVEETDDEDTVMAEDVDIRI